MRFLLVSPYLPHAAVGHGGGIATYQFARELATRHTVRVLCFERSGEDARRGDLEAAGVRVVGVPFRSDRDRGTGRVGLYADRLRALARARRRGEPLHVAKYWQRKMMESLRAELRSFVPDVVQFEYSVLAPYADALRRERAGEAEPLIILNTHEAGVLPRRRQLAAAIGLAATRRARAELAQWERHERYAARSADLVQCVTEQDRALYVELGGDPRLMWTQPLGVAVDALPEATAPDPLHPRLLFVGSFDHAPNRDAARWLVESFWPRARELHAQLRLDVVGTRPPDWLRAAHEPADRLFVHGFVEDLDHMFDGVTLFVAPLFSGGGIKIKILEALARRVCVVTTQIGAEGIEVKAGRDYWPAEDLEGFVAATERALRDPEESSEVARRAREVIAGRYRWSRLIEDLERRILDFRKGSP